MYVFSVNAKAARAFDDFVKGDEVPFIVYINFQDLFGAEQLCRLYLLQEGFKNPEIEKRKLIDPQYLNNKEMVNADSALKEALETGYSMQIFSAH